MLNSIQDNLEEDAVTLDLAIARIQKTIDAIERIQEDATTIPEDSLAIYGTRSGYTRAFVPVATAFELSKSSGKAGLDSKRLACTCYSALVRSGLLQFIRECRRMENVTRNYSSLHDSVPGVWSC